MNNFSFIILEEHIDVYAQISGDNNPIHINTEAALEQGFSRRVVHGMLSIGKIWTIISNRLDVTSMPKQINMTFTSPVIVGDEVQVTTEKSHDRMNIEAAIQERSVMKGYIVLRK